MKLFFFPPFKFENSIKVFFFLFLFYTKEKERKIRENKIVSHHWYEDGDEKEEWERQNGEVKNKKKKK